MHLATGSDAADALAHTSVAILVTHASHGDNLIAYANAAFTTLTGYTEAEVIGCNCSFLQGADTDPSVVSEIRVAVAAGRAIRCEILNYRKDGTAFWNDLRLDPVHDAAGILTGYIGIQSEAGAVRLATAASEEIESRLDSIASHIPGYIYRRVMDPDGSIRISYCSPSANKMLGLPGASVASTFYSHVHPDDLYALTAAIRSSAADMTVFREEFRLISADGVVHWMRSDAPTRRLPNGGIVWDGLALEIDAEKRWQNEIANLALRDPLTGLLTREAWQQALSLQIASVGIDAANCAVFYVDIDGFRELNDSVGHRVCDDILRRVAHRISAAAASVAGVAGRLGGDEFAVFVPGLSDASATARFAAALTVALGRPVEVGSRLPTISTSIGSSVHLGSGTGSCSDVIGELMIQADLALRWAKLAGPGGHAAYSPEQDHRFQNQLILARSLDHAIAVDELELHYQPLVDLASGRIVSAEALVRWGHPTLGMQWPDSFIPLAEKSGSIVELGRWVIARAMRQWAAWKSAGLNPPSIAINVSGAQLADPAFVPFVTATLKATKTHAKNFDLELTEGLLIEASANIIVSLNRLRDLGFNIVIDDFGSGHASFRYLRDFPVDKLKIDQLFVRKLVNGSSDALIIRAIISLARSMSVRVVAEGVETDMQRDFLHREGCEVGQGYLFSVPLVAEDFAWMLAAKVTLPLAARRHGTGPGPAISAPESGYAPLVA